MGLPQDPAQWLALLLAALLFLFGRPLLQKPRPSQSDWPFLLLAALSAALLSAGYVVAYLRNGPRIIDATSYFLEARALAAGQLRLPVDEPITATLGRFLLRTDSPSGTSLSVLFPPGYPALLAIGFWIGAPMAIGPCLAALLTIATYHLANHLERAEPSLAGTLSLPRLAALLSVVCAALRYHTADTMSHGLAALCVTSALAIALSPRQSSPSRLAIGFLLGLLFATRPFSALALAIALAFALRRSLRLPQIVFLILGAMPGLALFFAHQYAATGELFASSQRAYYAVSDGPPDCFRYGFGKGIGCLGEHGDFVEHNLPNGYNAYAALATTLRRLKQHLVDAGNAEPLFLLVLIGGILAAKSPQARVLVLAILAQILVYVPFYFDGNYPGGGARFYADILPLELLLLALAILHLQTRAQAKTHLAPALLALIVAGFSFRTGFDHAALRDREGGLPMFEPARLATLPPNALVFVDTDHGFNLGFDPTAKNPAIRRFHGDALDFLTYTALGKPQTYRYHFGFPPNGKGRAEVTLHPYEPTPADGTIEAESLWPPLHQNEGYALIRHASGTCASKGRWLAILPAPKANQSTQITLDLPASLFRGRSLKPRIALVGPIEGTLNLHTDENQAPQATWPITHEGKPGSVTCQDLPPQPIPPSTQKLRLHITHNNPNPKSTLALDSVQAQ